MMCICCEWWQIRKSYKYGEQSTPGEIALTTELIFKPNKVTDNILPLARPILTKHDNLAEPLSETACKENILPATS